MGRGDAIRWLQTYAAGEEPTSCVRWPFGHFGNGYGYVRFEGKQRLVHRVVMALRGIVPITDPYESRHTCGIKDCVNWTHLKPGSHSENELDKRVHGTGGRARGEANGRSRLTWDDVAVIRASTESAKAMAARFSVNQTTVRDIRRGTTWV